jgi:hypothetical protein
MAEDQNKAGDAKLSADRRFQELCAHIRTTDDVSFKLLGLVPIVNGAGIAAVIVKNEMRPSAVIYLVALFAAVVTLALLCWERRNIQICKWLRDRAASLEADALGQGIPAGHFVNFPQSALRLGKTEAEKFVYAVIIASWLLLPWVLNASAPTESAVDDRATSIRAAYVPLAWSIATAALALVVMPINAKPTDRSKRRKS